MLTVADALQLPAFAGARLVAGAAGSHRPIRQVHPVSVPDAANWLNGGELILTTAINLPADADGQRAWLEALVDKGVAGMGLAVGSAIDCAPDALREAAERHRFPLIELPSRLRFVDITRSANELIAQEHMALLERALNIQRVLTQLVLDGGDLQQLANTLAGLIDQSVSIENERFEALASANISIFDEARRYTLREGRTDPRLVRALRERGDLATIRSTLRPLALPALPAVGLEMERILAPVVVHGDIYGYVWIIADDRPLTDIDHMAIESGATIAALMMLHQEAVQGAEMSLKGSFFARLIEGGDGQNALLADQALRFGIDLGAPYRLLLVAPPERQQLLRVQRRIHQLAARAAWQAVVGQFAGQVLLLTPADRPHEDISAQLRRLRLGKGLRICVSPPQRDAANVPLAYSQCQQTLQIARRLELPPVTEYAGLGYLLTLWQAGPQELARNPQLEALRQLQQEEQADLFHTLETWLDAGGNGARTARALHIHRSTLNYRLQRIRSICGDPLSEPAARLDLQLALKQLRLFG